MTENWDFDAFLTGITPALTRYCAAIAGTADGEDAAQEALIRLWQNRTRIPNPSAAAVFVYRTAYRICVDLLRRRKRDAIPPEPVRTEADVLSEETIRALMSLSPADRAIVYSRVIEELPYDRIAARLGRTEAWARKRYSLARQKLAKILGEKV